jgi:hypothetical protein
VTALSWADLKVAGDCAVMISDTLAFQPERRDRIVAEVAAQMDGAALDLLTALLAAAHEEQP